MNKRTKLKKMISCIVLFLIILNFADIVIGNNQSYADEKTDGLIRIPEYDYGKGKNDTTKDGAYKHDQLNIPIIGISYGGEYLVGYTDEDGNEGVYGIYMQDGLAYGLKYSTSSRIF